MLLSALFSSKCISILTLLTYLFIFHISDPPISLKEGLNYFSYFSPVLMAGFILTFLKLFFKDPLHSEIFQQLLARCRLSLLSDHLFSN